MEITEVTDDNLKAESNASDKQSSSQSSAAAIASTMGLFGNTSSQLTKSGNDMIKVSLEGPSI